MIVSGSDDKTVRVWDLATGAPIGQPLTGHTLRVAVATAQLDGRPVVISGSDDKTVRVWDLATGAPIGRPITGHTSEAYSVATAQLDGRPVVISGGGDRTVRVWDLATGAPIGQPLTGHTDDVLSVATAQLDGRPVICLRRSRQDGAGVGSGHRRPDRTTPHRPHQLRCGRWRPPSSTAARWSSPAARQDGAGVGPGHRRPDRTTPHRPHPLRAISRDRAAQRPPGNRLRQLRLIDTGMGPRATRRLMTLPHASALSLIFERYRGRGGAPGFIGLSVPPGCRSRS